MQRCPQCEFIYEDDQSRCDMDGAELVYDSHPLPRLQALAVTTTSEVTPKPTWRRVVPFAAALVLAIVMALVYYVSVSRSSRAASTVGITTAETSATISEPSPAAATNSVSASQEIKNEGTETPSEKSNDGAGSTRETAPVVNPEAKKVEAPSAKKPADDRTKSTPRAQSNNQPRSKTEPEKESKVSSALKKTKRFFKRVF
jgi:hypothetical protein